MIGLGFTLAGFVLTGTMMVSFSFADQPTPALFCGMAWLVMFALVVIQGNKALR